MMGMWITHQRGRHPLIARWTATYCWLLAAFDIDPAATPRVMTMLDFNLWTLEQPRVPRHRRSTCASNDTVRMRRQPHDQPPDRCTCGHEFVMTGTDDVRAGPKSARWFGDSRRGRGQMRQLASSPTRRATGPCTATRATHDERHGPRRAPMIGVDHRGWCARCKVVPDCMVMGERGMADMGEEMELPENTLPMMTGTDPMAWWRWAAHQHPRVRRPTLGDYRDPGWFRQPPGTQVEWTGALPAAASGRVWRRRRSHAGGGPMLKKSVAAGWVNYRGHEAADPCHGSRRTVGF